MRGDKELIMYWLNVSEGKHYKRITYDGVSVLSIVRNYPKQQSYLANLILSTFEEIDEKNYLNKNNRKMSATPINNDMNSLLKLQRKLMQRKSIAFETNGAENVSDSPKAMTGNTKISEYNYDLHKFKCKLRRRASLSTYDPHYIPIIPPEPEYEPIEIIPKEPFTL